MFYINVDIQISMQSSQNEQPMGFPIWFPHTSSFVFIPS